MKAARPARLFPGSNCVTSFNTGGRQTVTAAYSGDATYTASIGSLQLDVTANPNIFQIVFGYFIQFASALHLFGL